jgi:hypothetical protein
MEQFLWSRRCPGKFIPWEPCGGCAIDGRRVGQLQNPVQNAASGFRRLLLNSPFAFFFYNFRSCQKLSLGLGHQFDGYTARPDGSFDFLFYPRDYTGGLLCPRYRNHGPKVMSFQSRGAGGFGPKIKTMFSPDAAGRTRRQSFVNQSPAALVEEIRGEGRDIWLMGGGEIVRD